MKDIIDFFNDQADKWDTYRKPGDDAIIMEIFKLACFSTSDTVLDIGCGTGVLVPFFRLAQIPDDHITAIDIADKMIKQFQSKYSGIKAVCTSLADYQAERYFSKVIIFNAFPHFQDPASTIQKAAAFLQPGGTLIIAHTMSREALNEHHHQVSSVVKNHKLIPGKDFKSYFQACRLRNFFIQDHPFFFAKAGR